MTIIISIILIIFLLIMLVKNPQYLKIVLGKARLLSTIVNAQIKLNGRVVEDAKAFQVKHSFEGQDVDELVLYIPDDTTFHRSIFIIDMKKGWLGLPNAGARDYELLQGKYLIQTRNGAQFKVLAGQSFNSKFKLSIEGNSINFAHPLTYDNVIVSVELAN